MQVTRGRYNGNKRTNETKDKCLCLTLFQSQPALTDHSNVKYISHYLAVGYALCAVATDCYCM